MPQMQLPIFPPGSTPINSNLSFIRKEGIVTYIYGCLPVFQHKTDDLRTFRMIISQFYVNGSAKQANLCRAFGISSISLKRSVKLYMEKAQDLLAKKQKNESTSCRTRSCIQYFQ